jgi:thiamine biosynthesis lipoprotein
VEIDGTRYSHVVDPRTGLGLTHRLLVTVVAADGTTADGLATTVGVLGPDAGRNFLNEHYPSARVYIRSASSSSD